MIDEQNQKILVVTDAIRDQLVSVIGQAIGASARKPDLTSDVVGQIERIAIRQSILAVVASGIKTGWGENLVTDKMKKHKSKSVYDYIQRKDALNQVANALETVGIDYIPLKGSVLRDLYPQPSMRESSDVDILIREKDLERAIEAIKSNTDFEYINLFHHDAQFVNQRVHLELHFSLLTNIDKFDVVLSRAWDYAILPGSGHCYEFEPDYQIFYVTIHAAKHFVKHFL